MKRISIRKHLRIPAYCDVSEIQRSSVPSPSRLKRENYIKHIFIWVMRRRDANSLRAFNFEYHFFSLVDIKQKQREVNSRRDSKGVAGRNSSSKSIEKFERLLKWIYFQYTRSLKSAIVWVPIRDKFIIQL